MEDNGDVFYPVLSSKKTTGDVFAFVDICHIFLRAIVCNIILLVVSYSIKFFYFGKLQSMKTKRQK